MLKEKYLFRLHTGIYDSTHWLYNKILPFVMDIVVTTPFKDVLPPLCYDSTHDIAVFIIRSSSPLNSLHASCTVFSATAYRIYTLSWPRSLSYRNHWFAKLINFYMIWTSVMKGLISLTAIFTAWKVSVFGVFLVLIFPHSDWKSIRSQSECGKIRTLFTQCLS